MQVNRSKNLSLKEKEFKLHVLEMFLEELHETERDMLNAEQGNTICQSNCFKFGSWFSVS